MDSKLEEKLTYKHYCRVKLIHPAFEIRAHSFLFTISEKSVLTKTGSRIVHEVNSGIGVAISSVFGIVKKI
jgi:hypothetical protein